MSVLCKEIYKDTFFWVGKNFFFHSLHISACDFKTFIITNIVCFLVSFLPFVLRSFTITGFHIAVPLVNTNFKDTEYSFYQSGVSLENYSPQ